jgi:ACS family hexuronate transporter-like MFS transporter
MNLGAGWFRANQGSYVSMFMIAGVAYLIAIAAIHLLAPRLEPARLREQGTFR